MTAQIVDVAQAVTAERLRQAQATSAGRRLTARPSRGRRQLGAWRPAPAYVLLLAMVALVLAFGGTATAAKLITGKQVKNGSITGIDVADGSLTGADVRDKSLTSADFTGSLQGPPGPRGPEGPRGPYGPQGAAGASGLQYAVAEQAVASGATGLWTVHCPGGKRALGGGVSSFVPSKVRVVESAPVAAGSGWQIGIVNDHTQAITAYAWVTCVQSS